MVQEQNPTRNKGRMTDFKKGDVHLVEHDHPIHGRKSIHRVHIVLDVRHGEPALGWGNVLRLRQFSDGAWLPIRTVVEADQWTIKKKI
jgi:hypothetical protein